MRNKNIDKKLKSYGALAAGLIAGISNTSGQIVYSDINPDKTLKDGTYQLDLNNDGTFDFLISQATDSQSNNTVEIKSNPVGNKNNEILTKETFYPNALVTNDSIKDSSFWESTTLGPMLKVYYSGKVYGYWTGGVQDKFLGLRIKIGADTFYGWARLDVPEKGTSFTIKDYAFNATPNTPIKAGDYVVGINDLLTKNIKLYTFNKTLYVHINAENVNGVANVYNLQGQIIKSTEINNNSQNISLDELNTGLYLVELNTNKGIVRKKIMIN